MSFTRKQGLLKVSEESERYLLGINSLTQISVFYKILYINNMSENIDCLEPKEIWKHFYSLTQIPRPSKHEGRVVEFLKKFGEDLGLLTIVDDTGNVIIRKPASSGMENRKGVILQGHIDMVPQKNSDKVHDFVNDPIATFVDGDWVTADGTTLGADNGMGVAAAMAVLESKTIKHGPVDKYQMTSIKLVIQLSKEYRHEVPVSFICTGRSWRYRLLVRNCR